MSPWLPSSSAGQAGGSMTDLARCLRAASTTDTEATATVRAMSLDPRSGPLSLDCITPPCERHDITEDADWPDSTEPLLWKDSAAAVVWNDPRDSRDMAEPT